MFRTGLQQTLSSEVNIAAHPLEQNRVYCKKNLQLNLWLNEGHRCTDSCHQLSTYITLRKTGFTVKKLRFSFQKIVWHYPAIVNSFNQQRRGKVLCFLSSLPSSRPPPPRQLGSVWLISVISLLLTNTVSPVRACLSIWLGRFRGSQKEDKRASQFFIPWWF